MSILDNNNVNECPVISHTICSHAEAASLYTPSGIASIHCKSHGIYMVNHTLSLIHETTSRENLWLASKERKSWMSSYPGS